MRKPGRTSGAELAVHPIDGGASRPLQPPPELTQSERETFAQITSTVKIGHFRPSDDRLLGLYVQALTLARSTGEAMQRDPSNPSLALIRAYDAATRRLVQLGTKLRLTPLARSPQKSGATNDAARRTSFYDYQNAGGTDEGWRGGHD
jgi:phage terminase small subunit